MDQVADHACMRMLAGSWPSFSAYHTILSCCYNTLVNKEMAVICSPVVVCQHMPPEVGFNLTPTYVDH